MCRNCGAIVGAGATECAVCGALSGAVPTTTDTAQHRPDKETIRFARAVLNRPYKFTIAFLILNLFVFLLMWESSGQTFRVLQQGFPDAVLVAYGAKLNYLINAPNNQWWRFITPMFVHIDVLHLLMNMFSLLILGPFVEKLYGSAKFVVFYVVSGIAGCVGTYLTLRPSLAQGALGTFIFRAIDGPSAGASGALFGLVGVLFVFGIKFRHELPEGFKRVFGTGLLPIIFINLFIGFVGRSFIGNSAHLSGLFAGAALALFVDFRRPGARASIATAWRVFQVLALALIVVSGYMIVRNFNRTPLPRTIINNPAAAIFLNYINAMNQLQERASALIHNNEVPDLEAVTQQAIQAPVPDQQAEDLRVRLGNIITKLVPAPAASPSPQPSPATPRPVDPKIVEEYKQWQKDYEEWLKRAAITYTAPP